MNTDDLKILNVYDANIRIIEVEAEVRAYKILDRIKDLNIRDLRKQVAELQERVKAAEEVAWAAVGYMNSDVYVHPELSLEDAKKQSHEALIRTAEKWHNNLPPVCAYNAASAPIAGKEE